MCAQIIFGHVLHFPNFLLLPDLSPWWHLPRLITSLGSKISLKWRETQMHFGAAESLRRLIGARKASADAKSRCHTFNSLSSIIIKKSFLMPKSLEIRTFTVITFCSQLRPDDFLFLLNFDNGAVFRQQTLVSLKKVFRWRHSCVDDLCRIPSYWWVSHLLDTSSQVF